MRKLLLLIGVFCISYKTSAQITVEGDVVLFDNNSRKVPGVMITKEGSHGTQTDNNGHFIIQFSGELDRRQGSLKIKPPSTGIYRNYIVMEVDGYHYVNTANITVGRIEPIKISLCSPAVYKKIVMELAKPFIEKALVEKDREISDLQKLNLSYEKLKERVQSIEDKYKIQCNNYLELAKKFARIDPQIADENLKNARKYFEQGDIEKAENSLPQYESIKNNIIKWKAAMSLLLSIEKTKGNFNEVKRKYDDILEHTGNKDERFELLINCSEYLFQYKTIDATLVDAALEYAKEANSLYKLPLSHIIYSYNLLGKIQKEQKDNNYYKNYKTAIHLFCTQSNNDDAKKNVAQSYIDYANYYRETKHISQAINQYHKALDIYINMYREQDYDDINYLNMLINLGICYAEKRNATLVDQCQKRIKILSKGKGIEQTFEDSLRVYNAMGTFYLVRNKYSDALWCYETAYNLCIQREQNTPIYKDKIIKNEFLIGLVLNYLGEYQESLKYCESARNKIEVGDTTSCLDLGYIYGLMANSYRHLGNHTASKTLFLESDRIAKICKNKELFDFIKYAKHEKIYIYIGNKRFNIQSYLWMTFMCVGLAVSLV